MTLRQDDRIAYLTFNEEMSYYFNLKASIYNPGLRAIPDGQVEFQFLVENSSSNSLIYPDSLLKGLSKIGGLLAILKLSLFLQYFHKVKFEGQFKKSDSRKPRLLKSETSDL